MRKMRTVPRGHWTGARTNRIVEKPQKGTGHAGVALKYSTILKKRRSDEVKAMAPHTDHEFIERLFFQQMKHVTEASA